MTSAVSMSVLEKYSSINRDIEQARNQRAVLESETEAIQERIHELSQERDTLQTDTVQASEEAAVFHSRMDEANKEYTKVEQEHTQAFLAKVRAQQEQTCLQQCLAENRQGFLEQSREFRSNCKRLRLRASTLGLDHASIRAFSIVNDMDGFIYDQMDQPPTLTDDEDTDDDPGVWVAEDDDDDDEEMKDQLASYLKNKLAFEAATQHFEKFKARKETEMLKAASRQDRRDKLQAQVDKIQKDNMGLEAELQEQASRVQDITCVRDSYVKSAATRKLQITQHKSKVTPSPLARSNQASSQSGRPGNTHNPYARSSTTAKTTKTATSGNRPCTSNPSNPSISGMSSDRRSELEALAYGRPVVTAATVPVRSTSAITPPIANTYSTTSLHASLLERQHPHRTGRIRRDRQFGCTVEITGPESCPVTTSRFCHGHVPDEEAQDDSTTPPRTSTLDQVIQALDDDDDDEEDEALFSYSAFSK